MKSRICVWLDLEGFKISDISQTEKHKYHMTSIMLNFLKKSNEKQNRHIETKNWLPEGSRGMDEKGEGNIVNNSVITVWWQVQKFSVHNLKIYANYYCCTLETKIILYINYTLIKSILKRLRSLEYNR